MLKRKIFVKTKKLVIHFNSLDIWSLHLMETISFAKEHKFGSIGNVVTCNEMFGDSRLLASIVTI